jgi:hypothetical protein
MSIFGTGGGVLIYAMRHDFAPGDYLPDVVTSSSQSLAGGAWIDAPDVLPAGSTKRIEEWRGLNGTARPDITMATRS